MCRSVMPRVPAVPAFQCRKSSRPVAVCSNLYMWIPGPISTAQIEHICLELPAVARINRATTRWFTDKSMSAAVVYGNHPYGVRRIGSPLQQIIADE